MSNKCNDMLGLFSEHISKSDIYAAKAIAKISTYVFKSRQDLKMTQKEFAKMMGVTQAMVSKWESADYNFTVESIAQIAEKLNTVFEIEFTPESEYLFTSTVNQYERISKSEKWEKNRQSYSFYVAA